MMLIMMVEENKGKYTPREVTPENCGEQSIAQLPSEYR
jgi:hypothetical protein